MYTCPKEDFCCAFVDGEVSSQLKKEFEEYLSQCEKCRQSIEQFKFLKNALISNEAPVLDLDKSFEKLLFKRNSIQKDSRRKFVIGMRYRAIVASSVAGIFLFAFLFVLLQHNSLRTKIYTLNKPQEKFTPILPISSYKQYNNSITNIDLYDMEKVLEKENKCNTKIYKDFTNTFNSFSVLYTPLNEDVNKFNVIMPNVTGNIIYDYGLSVPNYKNLNKNAK